MCKKESNKNANTKRNRKKFRTKTEEIKQEWGPRNFSRESEQKVFEIVNHDKTKKYKNERIASYLQSISTLHHTLLLNVLIVVIRIN